MSIPPWNRLWLICVLSFRSKPLGKHRGQKMACCCCRSSWLLSGFAWPDATAIIFLGAASTLLWYTRQSKDSFWGAIKHCNVSLDPTSEDLRTNRTTSYNYGHWKTNGRLRLKAAKQYEDYEDVQMLSGTFPSTSISDSLSTKAACKLASEVKAEDGNQGLPADEEPVHAATSYWFHF